MKKHFNQFIDLVGNTRYVDAETSGLDSTRYKIWSVQVGDGVNSTIITFPDESEEACAYLRYVLEGKLFVAHNAKFDLQVLWKLGVSVSDVWCTRIAEDCLNVGKAYDPSLKGVLKKYKLAELSKEIRGDFYLDINGKPSEDSGLPTIFENSGKVWTDSLVDYSFEDIEYLPGVLAIQRDRIAREGLDQLIKVENQFVKSAAGIEYFGMMMDLQSAYIFQEDMRVIRDQKLAEVTPKLSEFYFTAARHKYQIDAAIFEPWKANYEKIKLATNKMRDGNKLNAEATRLRAEHQAKRPFKSQPKPPEVFNLNSNQQLLMALNEAGVELETTGKNELLEKSVEHPVLAELLEFRKYEKLSQMLEITDKIKADGRLHPHITQIISTGRQAMSKPNLTQVPVRTKEGKRFRSLFQAAPGNKLVAADFSAIELVIAGVLSKDESLIYAVKNEADLHCYTIGRILELPTELLLRIRKEKEVTEDELKAFTLARNKFDDEFYLPELIRQNTPLDWVNTLRDYIKTITYGLIYGLSVFGLMEKFHCVMEVAESFTKKFFEVYPGLRFKIEHDGAYAEELMMTPPTPLGRFRHFIRPNYPTRGQAEALLAGGDFGKEEAAYLADQKYKELLKKYRGQINRIKRQSGNFAMQATSADITKLSCVLFEKIHPLPFSPAKIILTVHDEIIVECPENMTEQVALDLKNSMEKAAAMLLSIEGLVLVDTKVSDRWEK